MFLSLTKKLAASFNGSFFLTYCELRGSDYKLVGCNKVSSRFPKTLLESKARGKRAQTTRIPPEMQTETNSQFHQR